MMDISRAYLRADAGQEDPTYVSLPAQHEQQGCGKHAMLLKRMARSMRPMGDIANALCS